jgi:adenosine deaminase
MSRKAGVPLVFSADDGGVFRIDLTHEYVRAALEHGFTYLDLKEFSRNGLEYSFLEGASLWDAKGQRVAACALPGAPCTAFLKANEKASAQYELERRLDAFESRILTVGLK